MRLFEPKTEKSGHMPVVCVRSFFNGSFSRRHRKHRAWTTAATTLALLLILTVILLNTQAGFAVYFNGEPIGSAKTMEDVSAIVTGAEEQLREIFGQDYSLDNSISVSPDLGATADDTQALQNAIVSGVDGVTMMYVLEVDGQPVGASDTAEPLDDILNGIISAYSTPQTVSVQFAETVTVRHRFINNDIEQDTVDIRALLEPSNSASPYRLTVENTEQTQYTEEVAFEVEFFDDDTVYTGSTVVKEEGVPGENLITENTVFLNGVEQATQVISTVMTKAPVAERVAVGTAPRPKTASYGTYIWPAEGVMTSGFGPRSGFGSSNHQGIDIASFYGEEIVAADGGEVIRSESCTGYGLLVVIRHDNGDTTYYGHCSELLVSVGERVYQGQPIAKMGATGVANGIHCHFEIRINDEPVDPLTLLP